MVTVDPTLQVLELYFEMYGLVSRTKHPCNIKEYCYGSKPSIFEGPRILRVGFGIS